MKSFIAAAAARPAATRPRSFQSGSAKVGFAARVLATVLTLSAGNLIAADPPRIDLSTWTPPEIASVGDDPFGALVKYGHALFTDTANQIGPTVADPARMICFTTGWASTGALRQCPTDQSGAIVGNSYMSSSTDVKSCITRPNKREALA